MSLRKKIQLFNRAHFLLHTSVKEGFGLTGLEANSQKTPVRKIMILHKELFRTMEKAPCPELKRCSIMTKADFHC